MPWIALNHKKLLIMIQKNQQNNIEKVCDKFQLNPIKFKIAKVILRVG